MLVRVLHFLLGAVLGAGGGYLVWTHRSGGMDIFPPAAGMPWLVIAGVLLLSAGVVFLVSAVHPRPNRRARLAAEAADRDATLGAAESYYSERGRAADRDWRSGDIPEPAAPVAAPPAPALTPAKIAPVAAPVVAAPVVAVPVAATLAVAPVVAKPVATSSPPEAAASAPFPSTATLAPIPAAAEPPPAPVKMQAAAPAAEIVPADVPAMPVAVAEPAVAEAPFAAIRAALAAGNLDDAEKLLNAGRDTAQGLELAELTGLAGDHAAAMGRASNAKWLWRLALKRFGEQSAMDTPAAKAVAESLRISG